MSGDADDTREEGVELGLQAERTFLAWTRTALSFVLAGAVVLRALSAADVAGRRMAVGFALLLFGGLAAGFGWLELTRELDRHRQFTPQWAMRGVTAGTTGVCAVALVVALVVRP